MQEANDTSNGHQFVVSNQVVVELLRRDPQFFVRLVESASTQRRRCPPQQQEDNSRIDQHSNEEDDSQDRVPDIEGFGFIGQMSALQDAGPDDAEVGKPDNLVKQGYLL